MTQRKQTAGSDETATVAFRTTPQVKHLIQAAAARYAVLPSDWLRAVVEEAITTHLGAGALGRQPRTPQDFARDRYESKELGEEGGS